VPGVCVVGVLFPWKGAAAVVAGVGWGTIATWRRDGSLPVDT
jgi:hypothetical protein